MAIQPENPEVNFVPLTDVSSFPASESTAEKPGANTPAVKQETSNIVPSGNGSVMNGGALQSPNYSKGNSGWKIDSDGNIEANDGNFRGDITGASGTFSGTVTVNEINIGGDDASSAHIDSDGNFWTGASVANKLTAPVRINKDGTAFFYGVTTLGSDSDNFNQIVWDASNMQVNGSYVKNQDIFGDGSDGDVTISADTSLSSDMFYNNLTINTTKTLNPNGYRIFVKGTLTINGTGKIARNGNNGGNGGNATATTGGAGTAGAASSALADGSIKGALAGKAGVVGRDGVNQISVGTTNGLNGTAGINGTDVIKSNNSNAKTGVRGGGGGNAAGSGASSGGTAATAGTVTGTIYNKIHNVLAAYNMFDIYPESGGNPTLYAITSSPSSGGASSGGSGAAHAEFGAANQAASGSTGGSGGSGSNGGIVWIAARKIVLDAGSKIQANGGNGGNAGTTWPSAASNVACAGGSGGSAGGMGGEGGCIIIIYSSLTNNGTIECVGGTGGTGAAAGAKAESGGQTASNGVAGADGSTGNNGSIIYLQV